jgi:hypothetical protein
VSLRDSVEVENVHSEARPNSKEDFSRCSSGKSSSGKSGMSGNSSERRKARKEAEKEAEEARLASAPQESCATAATGRDNGRAVTQWAIFVSPTQNE